MVVYNDTFTTNSTSLVELITGMGSSMGSDFLIGNLIVLSFCLVFFIGSSARSSSPRDVTKGLIVNMMLTSILSILLYMAGMVGLVTILLPFILAAMALIGFFVM